MGSESTREMVTDKEIESAFKGTDFGSEKPDEIIKWGLLKTASGYTPGHTAKAILQELRLLSFSGHHLTNRGRYCLWVYFRVGYGPKGSTK